MSERPARTFTRDDLPDVVAARQTLDEFEAFLLERFAAYTRAVEVTNTVGERVAPIIDLGARTATGGGEWRLFAGWDATLAAWASDPSGSDLVLDYHRTGPGMASLVTQRVVMPLAFVFGDMEQQIERAEYLRLKAIYEPEATEAGPATATDTSESASDRAADAAGSRNGTEARTDDAASADAEDTAGSPYDDPRAGQRREDAKAESAGEDVFDFGFRLFAGVTEGLFGCSTPRGSQAEAREGAGPVGAGAQDPVQRTYAKARETLTGPVGGLFGEHAGQVVSVVDDLADLFGLRTGEPGTPGGPGRSGARTSQERS